jgi:hemerythrin-like domain-containing protein
MTKRHPSLIRLSRDHHHGLTLALRCRKQALGQLNPGDAQSTKRRAQEVKDFFIQRLGPHFEAEEKVLFPLLSSNSLEAGRIAGELLGEHEEIRKGVAGLEKETEPAKLLFDFGDLLERHIRREERELFPLFEQTIPPEQAEDVRIRIERFIEASN